MDVVEQRLYSQVFPGKLTFTPCLRESSHPSEKTHFDRVWQQSRSFGPYPKFMSTGESRNVDRLINREMCQLPLHYNGPVQSSQYCTAETTPIHLLISHSIPPSLFQITPQHCKTDHWLKTFLCLIQSSHLGLG